MGSFSEIVQSVVDFAAKIGPAISSGLEDVAQIRDSVVNVIEATKSHPATTPEEHQALDQQREQFEAQVNAHVDKTSAALRG